jgi:aminoglycoside 3-N-acetyltransferase
LESLKDKWLRSGVESGDTILVHSNLKRTLIESIGPAEILASFLETIGPRGTLLLPLFNFDFASGVDFDIRTSSSQMGALTEAGRLHNHSVRTGHPIYSFAVIGHNSNEFKDVNNLSGYAEDSPFGILKRLNGKIASLDLDDQSSMTFYHHVEEVKSVDYRYFKTFTGKYTDWDGVVQDKSYKLFVRDINRGVKTDVNPAGELLWQANLYKGCRPKVDTGLRVIKAVEMFNFVEKIIDSGNALGTLYSLEK